MLSIVCLPIPCVFFVSNGTCVCMQSMSQKESVQVVRWLVDFNQFLPAYVDASGRYVQAFGDQNHSWFIFSGRSTKWRPWVTRTSPGRWEKTTFVEGGKAWEMGDVKHIVTSRPGRIWKWRESSKSMAWEIMNLKMNNDYTWIFLLCVKIVPKFTPKNLPLKADFLHIWKIQVWL